MNSYTSTYLRRRRLQKLGTINYGPNPPTSVGGNWKEITLKQLEAQAVNDEGQTSVSSSTRFNEHTWIAEKSIMNPVYDAIVTERVHRDFNLDKSQT